MQSKRNWRQFTLRSLLGGSVIFALFCLLGLEWTKRRGLERQLSEMHPAPQLQIFNPLPLEGEYWIHSNVAVDGQLQLPPGYQISDSLTAEVKLFEPAGTKPIVVLTEKMNESKTGSSFRFMCDDVRQKMPAKPGNFPLIVEVFDGGKRIAVSATAIRFVDI